MILLCVLVIAVFALEAWLLGGITTTEGVKIGLYNALIVYALMNMKAKYAYILMGVKIIAGMFIASNILAYSVLGGLLSVAAMHGAKNIFKDKIGYLGISVIGAITHNIAIYILAYLSLNSIAVLYNIPSALLLSAVYGAVTGSLGYLIAKSNIFAKRKVEENEQS